MGFVDGFDTQRRRKENYVCKYSIAGVAFTDETILQGKKVGYRVWDTPVMHQYFIFPSMKLLMWNEKHLTSVWVSD